MGFRKPDLSPAYHAMRHAMTEIGSSYNDGFTSAYCKHDLYLLKSWLDEEYAKLPKFPGEDEWEKQRLMDLLRR